MDDTLCDFSFEFAKAINDNPAIKFPQATYGFFTRLRALPNAKASMEFLAKYFDVWILTRPSVMNPLCYTEKRVWVEENLGMEWCHKLILCPDKSLMKGDYLIDDFAWDGFEGEQLRFGSFKFPTWLRVTEYLINGNRYE